MPRRKRSNNPAGRPVTIGVDRTISLSVPAELAERTDAAAEALGVSRSQWWRDAAERALLRSS